MRSSTTRLSLVLLLALLPACAHSVGRDPRRGPTDLALAHVTVVDVESGRLLPDHTVLVRGGRIAQVSPSHLARIPAGAQVIAARGKYLIPGLWDAHSHITVAGESAFPVYVANGVTSVRDLGGRLSELLDWRRQVDAGVLTGPDLYVAGPNLEGSWWLDAVIKFAAADSLLSSFPFLEISPRYRIASPSEARLAVDSLRRLGVDMIKSRNLRGDEFRALASEARRLGIPLVGHAPRDIPLTEAADSGMRSIEHMETVMLRLGNASPEERRAVFAHLARAGTAITTTLVTDVAYRQTPDSVAYAVIADTLNRIDHRRRFLSSGLLAYWKFGLDTKIIEGPHDWAESHRRQLADLRLAREAGVPILVGSDLGVSLVYPGSSVHEELQLLVEQGGLDPLEALRGATVYPARTLGLSDSVGMIASGREADFVLLDANPLDNIRNTQRISGVVLDGRYFDRRGLDRLITEAERIANP
ncbi:MAG: amidohydrolase family protein [Gemmatimonadetes bacterium]|nr:amidohydrolase family protein [Gemmatimonadota bacterium]